MLSSFVPVFLLSSSLMQDVKWKKEKEQNEKGEEESVRTIMQWLKPGRRETVLGWEWQ